MNKNEAPHYIKIKPVEELIQRPLWTVLIPTYNCAQYLKETLLSVLAQDPGPEEMEIIVVDDHSTKDDPEAVVKHYGQGRVQFMRQKENVGKVRNYETGLQASKGHYIHQLHGDDKVRPEFYTTMAKLLKDHPGAGAAFCRSLYIDDQSRWTGMTGMLQEEDGLAEHLSEKLYLSVLIQTPSMVVKREVYETIGSFDRRLNRTEDWEMWLRIAFNYPVATTHKVLAMYRSHASNTSQVTFKDGTALKEQSTVCNIIDSHAPVALKKQLKRSRNMAIADYWLDYYAASRHVMSRADKIRIGRFILSKHISLKILYRLLK